MFQLLFLIAATFFVLIAGVLSMLSLDRNYGNKLMILRVFLQFVSVALLLFLILCR
ncbi:hypoxia induced conserved region family protein [Neorickettsia helminthoeca str. Oregon]|uniref:Hypoxia induced conserved region family protein n=1 Tax=Neorickettsia helminthoeca str. Oregon TaxID=1286528 RepID=X5H3H9_9RICK|nr:hypoxia induced conserved region family protein [Neorickettsia helminthoeca str. Oregon]